MSFFGLMARVAVLLGVWTGACCAQSLVPLRELNLGSGLVTQISFAPRGDAVAITFRDPRMGWLTQITRTDGQPLLELPGLKEETRSVVFAPDGNHFVWAVGARLVISSLGSKSGNGRIIVKFSASAIAFSPDGRLFAAASDSLKEGQVLVRLFDAQTGQVRGDLKAVPFPEFMGEQPNPLNAVAFSADGTRISAADNKARYVWDVGSFRFALRLGHYNGDSNFFSPDGSSLAIFFADMAGPSDGNQFYVPTLFLEHYRKNEKDEPQEFHLTGGAASGEWGGIPSFSSDGHLIIAPIHRINYSLTLWRTSDGEELLSRPTQFGQDLVAFGPTTGTQTLLASVYENPIDKFQHVVFWRLTYGA